MLRTIISLALLLASLGAHTALLGRPIMRARFRNCTSLLILVFCFASLSSPVDAAIVQSQMHPGEKLVVTFRFTSPPTSSFGVVDFIEFGGGISYTDFWTGGRASSVAVSLYDGDALLGTKQMGSIPESACGCIFLSPGSLGATTATVDIDMSSIISGTINGRIEYVPVFDAPSDSSVIDFAWQLRTGHYLGFGSAAIALPAPIIISSEIVQAVPMPAAVWLLSSALGVLGWVRRRVAS